MISARLSNLAASRMRNSGEKMNDYILFKNLDGKYLTLKDCIEENKKEETKAAEEEKTEESF